jgi:hypothetical protein
VIDEETDKIIHNLEEEIKKLVEIADLADSEIEVA